MFKGLEGFRWNKGFYSLKKQVEDATQEEKEAQHGIGGGVFMFGYRGGFGRSKFSSEYIESSGPNRRDCLNLNRGIFSGERYLVFLILFANVSSYNAALVEGRMDFEVSPAVNTAFDGFGDVDARIASHGFPAFGTTNNQGHNEKTLCKFI